MKNYFFVVNTRANGIMLVSVTALYCTFHQNLLGNKIIVIKWNSRSWKELIIFTSSTNPKYSNNTHMQTQISFHPKAYIKKVIRAASCLFSIWKLRFSEKKKKNDRKISTVTDNFILIWEKLMITVIIISST